MGEKFRKYPCVKIALEICIRIFYGSQTAKKINSVPHLVQITWVNVCIPWIIIISIISFILITKRFFITHIYWNRPFRPVKENTELKFPPVPRYCYIFQFVTRPQENIHRKTPLLNSFFKKIYTDWSSASLLKRYVTAYIWLLSLRLSLTRDSQ